tara:strand:+ start:470 stop:1348 length:879 start_codon:yes stop_codon:yes gene_type:complete
MSKFAFDRKLNDDGTPNKKYVDLLDEDKPISGQKFVCVSFVSPENILKEKNHFFFKKFLEDFEITKSIEKYSQFLNFLSYKYDMNFDDVMNDFQEYIKSEKSSFTYNDIKDSYKTFLDKNEEELENQFNTENAFQTSTRGLKIRGSYSTQEEAELRCRLLREVDPNHNVYVGPVGMWMPWDPEAYKTGKVEYLEEQLNQLMNEKTKNEVKAKQHFDQRIKDAKRKAIEENIKIATESGNKLTQNIDKNGNLYGVNNTIEDELNDLDNKTQNDVNEVLFNTDNVATSNKNKNN